MVNKQSAGLGLRAVEWRPAGKRRPGHVFTVFYCEAVAGSGMRCHCGVGVSLYRFVGLKGANVVYVSHNCPPPRSPSSQLRTQRCVQVSAPSALLSRRRTGRP